MRLVRRVLLIVLGAYAFSGFYIVPGNEKAVVRRFGKLVLPLKPSGLHYDWPFPFSQIDRLNFAAVQSLTMEPAAMNQPGRLGESTSSRAFLTGDQNLLQIRAQILFRPAEDAIGDFLFAQIDPRTRLAQLAESVLVDLLSHSGVDFAHVRGLTELHQQFTLRLRLAAEQQHLGLEIEQAVLEQVEPPARVKADFLDVSNARAEQGRNIQEARTWAEQRESQAESERQRLLHDAEADRRSRVASARGAADRFRHLIAQMRQEAERSRGEYAQVRQLAVQRMSWDMLREVWPKVKKKTVVDGAGPVDVSVFPKTP